MRELQAGAPDAARPLYERYFQRLIRLADRRLQGVPQQASSAEDVAAHAFGSFCLRLQRGDFTQLQDRDDLWRLLARITVHKALKLRRYHGADKRAMPEQDSDWGSGANEQQGKDLPPDLLVEASEELERLLDCLGDASLRSVALWRLEGYSNEEIAGKLGVVTRSVERKLRAIRDLWAGEVVP
jgi:DNA-directed RNA polymerase specialized sigma24 family protein